MHVCVRVSVEARKHITGRELERKPNARARERHSSGARACVRLRFRTGQRTCVCARASTATTATEATTTTTTAPISPALNTQKHSAGPRCLSPISRRAQAFGRSLSAIVRVRACVHACMRAEQSVHVIIAHAVHHSSMTARARVVCVVCCAHTLCVLVRKYARNMPSARVTHKMPRLAWPCACIVYLRAAMTVNMSL